MLPHVPATEMSDVRVAAEDPQGYSPISGPVGDQSHAGRVTDAAEHSDVVNNSFISTSLLTTNYCTKQVIIAFETSSISFRGMKWPLPDLAILFESSAFPPGRFMT
jgi:hypothetical protein